jgi:signal transduction histidine kinase
MRHDTGPADARRAVLAAAARALAIGVGVALLVAGSVTVASPWPARTTFAAGLAIGIVQAVVVGVVPAVLFTALGERLRRTPALLRWAFIVVVLMALALTGAAGARLIITRTWSTDAREFPAMWLPEAAVTAVLALAIGVVTLSFERIRAVLHRTTTALRDTEIERIRAERSAFEARLASLESRVRPHFLFNSLNAALALIPDDAPAAERVIERIASLLRASLDADPTRLVALGREMALVRDYLEIERVRFGDRLRFDLDVPRDLEAAQVPSFALQTLAENSVKHAIAPRPEGGRVGVEARREGARLVLTVRDDGPGFARDAIVEGHGLHTLRERLAALFGDRAAMDVGREDGRGSRVSLEVPFSTGNG